MKNYLLAFGAMVLATSLSCGEEAPAKPDKPKAPNTEKVFKMLDTDGNGSLGLEEFKASPRGQKNPARAEEAYKKMDTDSKDGVILEEFTAVAPAPGKGKISVSLEEFTAAAPEPGKGKITIQLTGTGTAFSGTIVWDSAAGFPDRYQEFLARYYGITATRVPNIIHGDGVTDIDGNFYPTVIIGNQEWMATNLRVTKYNNGDDILTGDDTEWSARTSGAYAIYPHGSIDGLDSDAEVVAAYGNLYNWFAVNDERGLAPVGWSVPSDDDWSALVAHVVNQGFPNYNEDNGAANALKSCRQVNHPDGGDCDTSEHPRFNSSDIHSGFDKFGFSALPGGFSWGGIKYVGVNGSWWSSSESSSTTAGYRYIGSNRGDFDRGNFNKRTGFSVRCFREVDN